MQFPFHDIFIYFFQSPPPLIRKFMFLPYFHVLPSSFASSCGGRYETVCDGNVHILFQQKHCSMFLFVLPTLINIDQIALRKLTFTFQPQFSPTNISKYKMDEQY